MTKIDQDFERGLLKTIHREVRQRYPWLDLRSALGATKSGRTWFVEGYVRGHARLRGENSHGSAVWTTEWVDCVVRWQGRANSAAHAKYQAWSDHLRKMDGTE